MKKDKNRRQYMLTEEEIKAISKYIDSEPSEIALRLKTTGRIRPEVVATQVDCRRRLKEKVPAWATNERLYVPSVINVQQSTSQKVAEWRAKLVEGDTLVDLTGGLGVDCYFMSRGLKHAVHTEPNKILHEAVRRNLLELDVHNITAENTTAEDMLSEMRERVGTIYIDPSRRAVDGQRVFRLKDCTPDVTELAPEMTRKAEVVLIKLSTLLDIDQAVADVPNVTDVYVIETGNECKDLMLRLREGYKGEPIIHAVRLSDAGEEEFTYTKVEEHVATMTIAKDILAGQFLFEPSPALMKAGPYALISERFGISQMSLSTHLYISEIDRADFMGRRFKILDIYGTSKHELARLGRNHPRASIAVRNSKLTVQELRRRCKIGESDTTYIFCGAGIDGRDCIMVCEKIA